MMFYMGMTTIDVIQFLYLYLKIMATIIVINAIVAIINANNAIIIIIAIINAINVIMDKTKIAMIAIIVVNIKILMFKIL